MDTDAQGSFKFDALPAGAYDIAATRLGYLNTRYGQLSAEGPGVPLILLGGQQILDLNVRMGHPVAIGGVVSDERGEFAVGGSVVARKLLWEDGHWITRDSGVARIDDRGRYRISSLVPGKYVVVATPPRPSGRPAGAPVYFPDALHPGQAIVLDMSRSGAQNDATNFVLVPRVTASVGGTVIGLDGKPVWARISLWQPSLDSLPYEAGTYSDRVTGAFLLTHVPPGQYRIEARVAESDEQLRTSVLHASLDVAVGASTIDGLNLSLEQGSKVSGHVDLQVLKADDPAVRLEFRPVDAPHLARTMPPPGGPVGPDGQFTLVGVPPGIYFLATRELPEGVGLASAEIGGKDVNGIPFEITSGGTSNLRIRLVRERTSVAGRVTDSSSRATSAACVIVFPEDARYWLTGHFSLNIAEGRPAVRGRIRSTRPATDGSFSFRDLPAGRYQLVALAGTEPDERLAPEFIKRLVSIGTPITLEGGKPQSVALIARQIPEFSR